MIDGKLKPEPLQDRDVVGERRKILVRLNHYYVQAMRQVYYDNDMALPPGLRGPANKGKSVVRPTEEVVLTMNTLGTQEKTWNEHKIKVQASRDKFQAFRARLSQKEKEDVETRGAKQPYPGYNA